MKNIHHIIPKLFLILGIIVGYPNSLFCSEEGQMSLRPLPDKIYGITLDSVDPLPDIMDAIGSLSKTPMSRIVFDEWVPASYYLAPVGKIHEKSYILGELLDSSSFVQYTLRQYKARTKDYLNTLGGKVDLWEVGNEINGEWLGKTSAVVAKMAAAFDLVKAQGGRTALTLYYNPHCWSKPTHEMFLWAATNIPERMKTGLDYVLVSYYEEDCNNYQPNWQAVMSKVSAMFPNSKVGIGECGTRRIENKAALINQYYSMNLSVPSFIGGYFWWYFNPDMVPKTKPLWSVLNLVLSRKAAYPSVRGEKMSKVTLKGNPFNTVGELPKVGSQAPDFKLIKSDLSEASLSTYAGKRKVLNIFPSIDTPTCALSVRAFNQKAAALKNTVVLCISADLPFAQKRFCGSEGISNLETLSTFRSHFGKDYQVEMADSVLKGLCSRAVIVLDENNKVLHSEQVAEIANEPNYEAALSVLK